MEHVFTPVDELIASDTCDFAHVLAPPSASVRVACGWLMLILGSSSTSRWDLPVPSAARATAVRRPRESRWASTKRHLLSGPHEASSADRDGHVRSTAPRRGPSQLSTRNPSAPWVLDASGSGEPRLRIRPAPAVPDLQPRRSHRVCGEHSVGTPHASIGLERVHLHRASCVLSVSVAVSPATYTASMG